MPELNTSPLSRCPAAVCTTLLFLIITAPGLLEASSMELPLFLQTRILQNALEHTLNLQSDGRAVLYQKDSFNYFHITKPSFSINQGAMHFKCNAAAGAGFEPLGFLPNEVAWRGSIDLNILFYVDPQWQLRYRIIDSSIYDEDGSKELILTFVWHLTKQYLHPILENFSFDLSLPKKEIIALLRTCSPPEGTKIFEEALGNVQAGILRPDNGGIVVPLLLTVAYLPTQPMQPLAEQKPLNEEEMETFQRAFEPLDAFLVFVVKTTGADFVNPQQRDQLFELLITSRYQLLSILAGEVAVDTNDPFRKLFISVWQQLKSIIENSEGQNGLMQEQLLRYMTFINAGDALLLLDTTAPELGMRITTDGLRQLARMLRPDSGTDPLYFDWQVDPVLRGLFNFIPEPDQETSTIGQLLLDLLIGTAHASEDVPGNAPSPARKFDRWVPGPDELDEYTRLVEEILRSAALEQLKSAGLESPYNTIYQNLVPATALMESCWRQYARKGDRIVFLCSKSGSIGMMQVNQHVWRGFYSIDRLKWDLVYNIQSGTQILMHYFKDYGLKVADKTRNPAYAARSAYSAYNAGPQAARRFFKNSATAREKKVDKRLWSYFQSIVAGGSVNLAACNVDQGSSKNKNPYERHGVKSLSLTQQIRE